MLCPNETTMKRVWMEFVGLMWVTSVWEADLLIFLYFLLGAYGAELLSLLIGYPEVFLSPVQVKNSHGVHARKQHSVRHQLREETVRGEGVVILYPSSHMRCYVKIRDAEHEICFTNWELQTAQLLTNTFNLIWSMDHELEWMPW